MQLSIRLEAILQQIRPGRVLADIGTDHGYLPVELIRRGVCDQALACDVRSGPLERARAHVTEARLDSRIHLRLSNGFEQIEPGEVDGAILAGMGGMLIRDILLAESRRPKNILRQLEQLVVQPQSDYEAVRRTLHALSFQIAAESLVIDRDQYYWILVCRPGQQHFEKDWQYRYGACLPEAGDALLLRYLAEQKEKSETLLRRLQSEAGRTTGQRCTELTGQIQEIHMVMEEMGYGADASADS